MKRNISKILIFLSIICYILAHIFPVYSSSNHDAYYYQGIWMNLLGWFLIGKINFYTWCANPIYLITLFWMAMVKACTNKYCPSIFTLTSILTLIMSTLAAILGLLIIWNRDILLDEAGHVGQVETLYIGYWLWEAAFVLLAIALWIKWYITAKL